ncbi:C-type lectin domain family 11 member A [Alligator sinensis]|uniref:C-type lectin domain family 11 member A n=1 Tax=Alligator sinensis TaxID=38654 RepID=A0A1U7R7S7_ALLSI|nr:C-type lectin domain family 11 member A [Alligator sinensis]
MGCKALLLLLLGLLLGTPRGQSQSEGELSSTEREALMLKHLQEVLQLPEVEGQGSPEVTLTELGPDGSKEGGQEEVEDGAQGREDKAAPMQPAMTTVPPQPEEEDGLSYIFSRLASLDTAVHRLNVQFHAMDVRMAQFSQGLTQLRTCLAEAQEVLSALNQTSTRNQHDIGRMEGCLRGRRTQTKCFLIFKEFEGYDQAHTRCQTRGGNLAMPADATELGVLRRYLYDAFQPSNWPCWVGIHDRRAEGLWLFENGQRVSVFDWYKDHLVSQPNGGMRENCISLSSDDGKWWDSDCAQRMYYVCEYRL